jgi:hypothetical protein
MFFVQALCVMDSAASKILDVRCGNQQQAERDNMDHFLHVFPDGFPFGHCGFRESQPVKLSIAAYLQLLLRRADILVFSSPVFVLRVYDVLAHSLAIASWRSPGRASATALPAAGDGLRPARA